MQDINSISAQQIQNKWNEVMIKVRPVSPIIQMLLKDVKPLFVSGDHVWLLSPSSFHRDNIEKKANKKIINRVISACLNREVEVHAYLSSFPPLDLLEQSWGDIKHAVRPRSPMIQALLNAVRPIKTSDGEIVLLAASLFHVDNLLKKHNLHIVSTTIEKIIGVSNINIVVISETEDAESKIENIFLDPDKIEVTPVSESIVTANPQDIPTIEAFQFQQLMVEYLQNRGASGIDELFRGLSSLISALYKTAEELPPSIINNASLADTNIVVYDGLRFRSKTEIKIYEALKKRRVLFFANSTAVLGQKNTKREPDFLVCQDGRWGILEVMGEPYHPSATAMKDHDRARLFKNYGLHVIEFYDANRCYNHPDDVVDEFLNLLSSSYK